MRGSVCWDVTIGMLRWNLMISHEIVGRELVWGLKGYLLGWVAV